MYIYCLSIVYYFLYSSTNFLPVLIDERSYAAHNNVFNVQDLPIVYGASTATILLTRAMAWFLKYTSGWDYFVPVVSTEYSFV